jgi:predicted nicotinamide N-methyase
MPAIQQEVEFESLARRASQRFKWRWETTEIAGRECQLAVASDPDSMLLDACRRQDAGEQGVIDPFWATTWRAAAGLDHYLDRIDISGARVLEIGCGTGHAGLAAAHRGGQVVLTDGVSDPLLLVRMSAWNLRDRCRVRRLQFGIDRLDEPRFPWILGSDVTYLRSLWPLLDQCLKDHLDDDGQVLLSDPYRIIANEFRDWIQRHGWHYSEHRMEFDDDSDHPIRVMQLTRKAVGTSSLPG